MRASSVAPSRSAERGTTPTTLWFVLPLVVVVALMLLIATEPPLSLRFRVAASPSLRRRVCIGSICSVWFIPEDLWESAGKPSNEASTSSRVADPGDWCSGGSENDGTDAADAADAADDVAAPAHRPCALWIVSGLIVIGPG
uniref:Uncharacterized protein n=1 Tax=Anopheles atroparvus TaxID=41427 RepID=A0A182IJW8_ANOAO